MSYGILIVDDEPQVREVLKRRLERPEYVIHLADGVSQGLEILSNESIDIVISDYKMPGLSGTEFLSMVRQKSPGTERILMTAYADLDMAINAINNGEIYRFFTKPCNFDELAIAITQALERRELFMYARRFYSAYKMQAAAMKKLERQFPGLTDVQKTDTGSFIIEDPNLDVKSFLTQVHKELK